MKKKNADHLFREAIKLRENNNYPGAMQILRQILEAQPQYHNIHFVYNELGIVALNSNQVEDAEDYFEKALRVFPKYCDALCNLGCLYGSLKNYEKALCFYKRALEINALDEVVLSNVIKIYLLQNRTQEILERCQQVLRVNPKNLTALKGIGDYYVFKRDWVSAKHYYDRALAIAPKDIEIYYKLGDIETNFGRMAKAIEYYEKVLKIAPGRPEPYNQIGRAFLFLGKSAAARINFDKSLKCGAESVETITSNMLFSYNYDYNYDPEDLFRRHVQYNNFFDRAIPAHNNNPDKYRKLKVGYVSADFRGHPVAFFVMPVFTNYNRNQFEVICYANVTKTDTITNQIKGLVDEWRDISALSAAEIAKCIAEDKIDILVDLSGHTAGNMLPVFAMKPAPVQVTWLGYPNTTGLKTMDYRITDAYADPLGLADQRHTEQLIRMPRTFLCYAPLETAPDCIQKEYTASEIVFGCFNNFAKVTDEIVTAWCDILKRVEKSKLVLKSFIFAEDSVVEEFKTRFQAKGVDPGRVVMLARDASSVKHLNRYNDVDIALDTYPYHGTTTTCEALYMGVPVVTIEGDRHAARVGVSLLTNIGVPELIARDIDDYINKVCDLAKDIKRLSWYKQSLRNMMRESSLMDDRQFTIDLEYEYRKMWQTWCNSKSQDKVIADMDVDKASKTIALLNIIAKNTVSLRKKLENGSAAEFVGQASDIIEAVAVIQQFFAAENVKNQAIQEICLKQFNEILHSLLGAFELSDSIKAKMALVELNTAVDSLLKELQNQTAIYQCEREVLLEKINKFPFWYHKIELPGGIVTPGWAPLNIAAYNIPEDLTGMRVLDVGAWDGFWSFEALKRGAKQVVAIDDFSDFLGKLENTDRRAWETFDLCKAALGYSDEQCQRYDMSVYDIDRATLGEFDIVFFFGTLYHLRHPLLALDKLYAVCKKEIYVETAILDDFSPFQGGLGKGYSGNQIVAEFYSGDQYGSNNTNWWVPTKQCLGHLLIAAGFCDVTAWKLTDKPQGLPHCRGFAHGKKR